MFSFFKSSPSKHIEEEPISSEPFSAEEDVQAQMKTPSSPLLSRVTEGTRRLFPKMGLKNFLSSNRSTIQKEDSDVSVEPTSAGKDETQDSQSKDEASANAATNPEIQPDVSSLDNRAMVSPIEDIQPEQPRKLPSPLPNQPSLHGHVKTVKSRGLQPTRISPPPVDNESQIESSQLVNPSLTRRVSPPTLESLRRVSPPNIDQIPQATQKGSDSPNSGDSPSDNGPEMIRRVSPTSVQSPPAQEQKGPRSDMPAMQQQEKMRGESRPIPLPRKAASVSLPSNREVVEVRKLSAPIIEPDPPSIKKLESSSEESTPRPNDGTDPRKKVLREPIQVMKRERKNEPFHEPEKGRESTPEAAPPSPTPSDPHPARNEPPEPLPYRRTQMTVKKVDESREPEPNIAELKSATIVLPDTAKFFDDLNMDKKKIYEPTQDVYVEQRKSFRRTRRAYLESALMKRKDEIEAQAILENSALKSVTYAIAFQTGLNLLALLLQGFLSGLAVAHVVFAFVFADRDLLLRGYRWMSLPVHATFMVCYILGIMAAVDRVSWQEFRLSKINTWIKAFGGVIQLIPMIVGLAASEMSLYFDESLSPLIKNPEVTEASLSSWRILSAVRAGCAIIAWITVAVQPTNTAILEHIANFMLPEDMRDAQDFMEDQGERTSKIPKMFSSVVDRIRQNRTALEERRQMEEKPESKPSSNQTNTKVDDSTTQQPEQSTSPPSKNPPKDPVEHPQGSVQLSGGKQESAITSQKPEKIIDQSKLSQAPPPLTTTISSHGREAKPRMVFTLT